MKTSDDGMALIMRSEGCTLQAYADPGSGNSPWTIGYGHTSGVRRGDVCTPEQAETWLCADCGWAEQLVNDLVSVPMTQGQFDALVSFTFNMGPGARGVKDGFAMLANGNQPTLRWKLNAGDYEGAAAEFSKWAHPPLLGIRIRRAREQLLFKGGDWRTIRDGKEPF
jgi:lysozyme